MNGQCIVNLCLNGGTCSAYMNTYRCHCPDGFQGKHCEGKNLQYIYKDNSIYNTDKIEPHYMLIEKTKAQSFTWNFN